MNPRCLSTQLASSTQRRRRCIGITGPPPFPQRIMKLYAPHSQCHTRSNRQNQQDDLPRLDVSDIVSVLVPHEGLALEIGIPSSLLNINLPELVEIIVNDALDELTTQLHILETVIFCLVLRSIKPEMLIAPHSRGVEIFAEVIDFGIGIVFPILHIFPLLLQCFVFTLGGLAGNADLFSGVVIILERVLSVFGSEVGFHEGSDVIAAVLVGVHAELDGVAVVDGAMRGNVGFHSIVGILGFGAFEVFFDIIVDALLTKTIVDLARIEFLAELLVFCVDLTKLPRPFLDVFSGYDSFFRQLAVIPIVVISVLLLLLLFVLFHHLFGVFLRHALHHILHPSLVDSVHALLTVFAVQFEALGMIFGHDFEEFCDGSHDILGQNRKMA
ncbi:hypothetical protein ACHAXS_013263 [Conticribra weissflogii]